MKLWPARKDMRVWESMDGVDNTNDGEGRYTLTSLQKILPMARKDFKTTEAKGIHHFECAQFRIIHAKIAYFVDQQYEVRQCVKIGR
jgi:hypothetical protein